MLFSHGGASDLDVSQSEQLVYTASESIPDLERQIEQQENVLSILLGENPQSIPRSRAITEQPLLDSIPAGLPSQLLERRPDVREAEQDIVAANAQIGVAKAAFFAQHFPDGHGRARKQRIESVHQRAFADLERGVQRESALVRGRKAPFGLRLARAQWQESVLSYQQTVQNALEQVSNSLVGYQKFRDFRGQQELLTQAAQRSDDLSLVLYKQGGASYLQVLTSETNYFSAKLNLVQAQLNERLALVQVYEALGGGWQE